MESSQPTLLVQRHILDTHPAVINDGCCKASAGIASGFKRAVSSGESQGKPGLIIWCHFLGGQGADWERCLKSKIAHYLPWVEWHFPEAPKRAVTNYDGAIVPAWFDQLEGQVSERTGTPGLEGSVATVHALIRQAEAQGIPANRIMLGGMSQGGVLAIAAGLSYEKPLAGVISVSSWVPSHLLAAIRQPSTPLFLGNGDRDEVVPLGVFLRGASALERAGCNRISKKQYPGLTHTFADYEKDDIRQFVSAMLPNTVESL
jgi:predicted esterase